MFRRYQFRLCVCSNHNNLTHLISPFICTLSPKSTYYPSINLALKYIRFSSSDWKTKTQKTFCKFTIFILIHTVLHLCPPSSSISSYWFSVLSRLNWNVAKFNGYEVWPLVLQTVIQRYIVVTEVGLPAILTRMSRGFYQFLLANFVELSGIWIVIF